MGAFEDEANRLRGTPETSQDLLSHIAHLLRASNPVLNFDTFHTNYHKDVERFLVRKIDAYYTAIADRTVAEREAALWLPANDPPPPGEVVLIGFARRHMRFVRAGYVNGHGEWFLSGLAGGVDMVLGEQYAVKCWRAVPAYPEAFGLEAYP